MPMIPDIEIDLSYMQDDDFRSAQMEPWRQSGNEFERRLAKNLQPGLQLDLDFETLKRVLGSAALACRDAVVTVDLTLRPGGAHLVVVLMERAMPPICADDCGNLLPALRWYSSQGAHERLRLSVCARSFFWIHAFPSVGTQTDG
jgi:hypothetical protein